MKHSNIPIFIPHLGCPHDCVFCNQRIISGKLEFDRQTVVSEIETALATVGEDRETEIAFFGGSFTGIDRDLMLWLLGTAQRYVDAGRVQSIRLSTRPDYIDEEILGVLSRFSVKTIELGLQSMNDEVLALCHRGHDSARGRQACRLIKSFGFDLVGQMMIGLPGADGRSEIETARQIVSLGADAARVYPTVVFHGTALEKMTEGGLYSPLSTADAVERTKEVLKVFDTAGVPCIRVGLCASENLSDPREVVGGASHSAIGELAMGEIFFENMSAETQRLRSTCPGADKVVFLVPKGATSKAVGQRRINISRLTKAFGLQSVKVRESEALEGYEVLCKNQ